MLAFLGLLIAWAIAFALAVALLALVLPLRLEARLDTSETPSAMFRVRPFGGLAPWINLPALLAAEKDAGQPPPKKRGPITVGKTKRLFRAVPALLQEVVGVLRVDRLWAVVDVGLHDPADTGALFGQLAPMAYGAMPALGGSLVVRPDFDGPRFEAEGGGAICFIPLSLGPPIARFAWRVWGP